MNQSRENLQTDGKRERRKEGKTERGKDGRTDGQTLFQRTDGPYFIGPGVQKASPSTYS